MNIKKHYQDFFAINDMGIGEADKLNIDWAQSLLEDYKAEKAKSEPTHQQLLEFEKTVETEVIEKWSEFEIIKPRSKKKGFTKIQFIRYIFSNGFGAAINFLFEHKKRNDKEFAEAIKMSDAEIQEMIDEALENINQKTKMTQENNEIANKYGVVTFETAKKLDWKEETNFLYLGTSQLTYEECIGKEEIIKPLKFRLCMPMPDENFDSLYCFENKQDYSDLRRKGSQEFYYAPQMQDITPFIPKLINYKAEKANTYSFFSTKGVIYYERCKIGSYEEVFRVPIVENNYAEAYAKLYLLLVENGCIE